MARLTPATVRSASLTNLYDLKDSAYDAPEIKAKSVALGHVPIIQAHPRSVPSGREAIATEALAQRAAGYALAEDVRYNERSAAERINGGVKDDFGARYVRCAAMPRYLPPDVRHSRLDHRSPDAIGHVATARRRYR